MKHRSKLVCLFSLLLLLSFPLAAQKKDLPEPVHIQTLAASGWAAAGGNEHAAITAVVTGERGEPLDDLGDSVFGDGTSAITLPAGWSLHTPHVEATGMSCILTPTAFLNGGFDGTPGSYLITVVPFTSNPECEWVSGEYHYVVRIDMSSPETPGLQGSGLGKLTIP